jgi:hypothetical protein
MIKILLILLTQLLYSLCFGQLKHNQDLQVFYWGYSRSTYNNDSKNNVKLGIVLNNIGKDTLYISKNHIQIIVSNDNKIIKEVKQTMDMDKEDYTSHPFIPPTYPLKYKEIEKDKYLKIKDSLINNYAEKLFDKNLKRYPSFISYKTEIVDGIIDNFMLLFPKETLEYNYYFRSEIFDKNSEVNVYYKPNDTFTIIERTIIKI